MQRADQERINQVAVLTLREEEVREQRRDLTEQLEALRDGEAELLAAILDEPEEAYVSGSSRLHTPLFATLGTPSTMFFMSVGEDACTDWIERRVVEVTQEIGQMDAELARIHPELKRHKAALRVKFGDAIRLD